MRSLVILAVVAALGYAAPVEDRISDPVEYIKGQGYPAQRLTVQTEDGYILNVYRISGASNEKAEKKPVLIMHGLLGSADEFLAGGKTRGLAFKLADRGFDVYLGSVRGSKYGRQHTYLSPDTDPAFWKFTVREIGAHDVPETIELISSVTNQRRIYYIGYNQGNTAFFVMTSSKPQYNSRVSRMIALGPMVYMKNAHHPLMSLIKANLANPAWLAQNLGKNEFRPSEGLKNQLKPDCINKKIDEQVCSDIYYLVNGYSPYFNQTIVPELRVQNGPSGVSVAQLKKYAETVNSDDFHGYDLSAVTVPTYMLSVPEDLWSNEQDVNKLSNELSNVKENYPYNNYQSIVDLVLAKDAYQQVHDKILNIFQ